MNPAEARAIDSSRCPPHLPEAGFMQPCPRRIRIELDGAVLAESDAPVLLFETGLPTRHYIQRTDLDFTALERMPMESPRSKFSGDDS